MFAFGKDLTFTALTFIERANLNISFSFPPTKGVLVDCLSLFTISDGSSSISSFVVPPMCATADSVNLIPAFLLDLIMFPLMSGSQYSPVHKIPL